MSGTSSSAMTMLAKIFVSTSCTAQASRMNSTVFGAEPKTGSKSDLRNGCIPVASFVMAEVISSAKASSIIVGQGMPFFISTARFILGFPESFAAKKPARHSRSTHIPVFPTVFSRVTPGTVSGRIPGAKSNMKKSPSSRSIFF